MEEKDKAWYSFCDKFAEGDMKDSFTNLVGDEKMTEVEEWAKNFPEVKICRCDDNHFATSFLVLIPTPTMGIQVVYIPQLTYEKSNFFLYPNHQKMLLDALREIDVKNPYYEEERINIGFKDFVDNEKDKDQL